MLPRLRCKQDFSWEPKTLLVSTIISIRFARYYTPPLFPSLLISFFSFVVLSLLRIHGIESAFSFLCFVAYLVSYFETTSFSSPYIPFETFDFVCFPSVATYSINVLYFLLNRDLWFIGNSVCRSSIITKRKRKSVEFAFPPPLFNPPFSPHPKFSSTSPSLSYLFYVSLCE